MRYQICKRCKQNLSIDNFNTCETGYHKIVCSGCEKQSNYDDNTIKKCVWCGESLWGRKTKFCSKKCKSRHEYALKKKYKDNLVSETRVCRLCGISFTVGHSAQIYCNKKCQDRAGNKKKQIRDSNYENLQNIYIPEYPVFKVDTESFPELINPAL